jgi:hypothetical protein
MALKSHFFKDRGVNDNEVPSLLKEIRGSNLSLNEFVIALEKCLPFLPKMEQEDADEQEMEMPLWNFSGYVRTVLDLVSPSYFKNRMPLLPQSVVDSRNKYRRIYESKI